MHPKLLVVGVAAFVTMSGRHSHHLTVSTTPRRLQLCLPANNDKDDDGDNSNDKETETSLPLPVSKPRSRLAQLAEDWMEEEEEDELQQYWQRFDDKTQQQQQQQSLDVNNKVTIENENDDSSTLLTTEQRLERYYDRRGINKAKERQYQDVIERAIRDAQTASNPEEAITVLEEVQPWLQVGTRLGGRALYELAVALWQKHGQPDEALLQELIISNPHVRDQVQRLIIKNGNQPPPRHPRLHKNVQQSLWQGLFDPKNRNNLFL